MARHPETRKGFDSGDTKTEPGKSRARATSKPPPIPTGRRGKKSSTSPPPSDEDPTEVSGVPTAVTRHAERDRSVPIQVISMKTPAELAASKPKPSDDAHARRKVNMRSYSDVAPKQAALGGRTGNLAPPRDASQARGRRAWSNVRWALIALALAVVVATVFWAIAH